MNIGAIIPARYNSSRFPGKPLAIISGISMIERVYRQAEKSGRFNKIIVATDNQSIADEVNRFGGIVEMTPEDCLTGTDRVWEVLKKSELDGAVNIQGDEPLISEDLISAIHDELTGGKTPVVTAAFHNNSEADFQSPNVVKCVFDSSGSALYFSRSPVPGQQLTGFSGFYHHVGIYGYTRKALAEFTALPPSRHEQMEKLEQLRFLDNGIRISVVQTEYRSIGVDVPKDIKKIENIIGE